MAPNDCGFGVERKNALGESIGKFTLEKMSVTTHIATTGLAQGNALGDFDQIFTQRIKEADEFYDAVIPSEIDKESKKVARQVNRRWHNRVTTARPSAAIARLTNGS